MSFDENDRDELRRKFAEFARSRDTALRDELYAKMQALDKQTCDWISNQ